MISIEDLEEVLNSANGVRAKTAPDDRLKSWQSYSIKELISRGVWEAQTPAEVFLLDKLASVYDALVDLTEG